MQRKRTDNILSQELESIKKISTDINSVLSEMNDKEITALSLELFKFNGSQCGPVRVNDAKTAALIQLDRDVIHALAKSNINLRNAIVWERIRIFHGGKLPEHKPTPVPSTSTTYPRFVNTMSQRLKTTDDIPENSPVVTRRRANTI